MVLQSVLSTKLKYVVIQFFKLNLLFAHGILPEAPPSFMSVPFILQLLFFSSYYSVVILRINAFVKCEVITPEDKLIAIPGYFEWWTKFIPCKDVEVQFHKFRP